MCYSIDRYFEFSYNANIFYYIYRWEFSNPIKSPKRPFTDKKHDKIVKDKEFWATVKCLLCACVSCVYIAEML